MTHWSSLDAGHEIIDENASEELLIVVVQPGDSTWRTSAGGKR
ncbi:MAG TPA: hypothetical protein VFI46_10615 [Jiangellaceae bacterium]|nr:hypothetical protein [Jiangellaceae bacterium]